MATYKVTNADAPIESDYWIDYPIKDPATNLDSVDAEGHILVERHVTRSVNLASYNSILAKMPAVDANTTGLANLKTYAETNVQALNTALDGANTSITSVTKTATDTAATVSNIQKKIDTIQGIDIDEFKLVTDTNIKTNAAAISTIKADIVTNNANAVHITGNESISGVKTFTDTTKMNDVSVSGSLTWNNKELSTKEYVNAKELSTKEYVDAIELSTKEYVDTEMDELVNLTGNQTIAGIKTFSSSPIVPTPTTGTQAVNKDYVDNSSNALSIGAILYAYTILDNCIVAFGGEFNRADYPKLWAYLQANPSLLKTQAQWTTENATNGMCGYYSDGDGTTTFRVPNLNKAFLRPDSRGVGSYQADEFKSHTHGVPKEDPLKYSEGSTKAYGDVRMQPPAYEQTEASGGVETRPKNIAVLPLIVAK